MSHPFSRRAFLLGAIAAAGAAGAEVWRHEQSAPHRLRPLQAPTAGPRPAAGRSYWPLPDAALFRGLGSIATGTASEGPGDVPKNQPFAAGRGIPLGGIGTGSFMYNQAGTFGPWEFRNGVHEERILPQGALHYFERVGQASPTVRTLATPHPLGEVLTGWTTLAPGDGVYAALYPFAWVTYDLFTLDVSLRVWSPIVAGDDQRSSQPLAYFDVQVANSTSSTAQVGLMLTFPNAPLAVTDSRPVTRTGYYSHALADAGTGMTAVILGASSPSNVVDADQTEWCLGAVKEAGQTATHARSWNGSGDGSDIWAAFAAGGRLPNGPLESSSSAGAVALSATLAPGATSTMRFVLAWDFPKVLFGSPSGRHTVWMKRYTGFYGGQESATNDYVPGSYAPRQGAAIARAGAADWSSALAATQAWWNPYATDPNLPLWLRRAALNELYYTVFGASFWEGGLVSNSFPSSSPQFGKPGGPRIGSQRPGTHLSYNLESTIYPNAESYDVRAYFARVTAAFWPSIERDIQVAWTDMVMQDEHGHAPHDAGRPTTPAVGTKDGTSPYIVWPGYPTYAEHWVELPVKYLLQVWQYMETAGDWSFLEYAYPAILRSYQWLSGVIPAGQALPVDDGTDTTYDTWPFHGHTTYTSGLWILGLQITLAAANQAAAMGITGTPAGLVAQVTAQIAAATAALEANLWDPGPGWYRTSTGDADFGGGVMADALFAQHAAWKLSLPSVADPGHTHTHLTNSYAALVTPWHDAVGGLVGARNGVNPDGSAITTHGRQPEEVWTGVSYLYAATQYLGGTMYADPALQANGLALAEAVAALIWDTDSNGYQFASPEAWQASDPTSYRALQYSRPRAIWELVFAIHPPAPLQSARATS